MTPSSCSTAPPSICSQLSRSTERAMMARLRIKDVAIGKLRTCSRRENSNDRGDGFLFGERTIHFVAHQLGQMAPQRLSLGRERVARARNVERHNGLDTARARGENGHAVREGHSLVDVMRDEEDRGAAIPPDIE